MSLSSDNLKNLPKYDRSDRDKDLLNKPNILNYNLENKYSNNKDKENEAISPKMDKINVSKSLNPNLKYKNDHEEKENMTVKNILRNSFSKITQQKNKENSNISSPKSRGRSFILGSPKSNINYHNLTSQSNLISKLNESKSKSKFENKNYQAYRHLLRKVENRLIDK